MESNIRIGGNFEESQNTYGNGSGDGNGSGYGNGYGNGSGY